MRLFSCFLPAWLLTASPLLAQQVLLVDDSGGPGVQFTEIQAAVDAAAAGDILVIRQGVYAGFDVNAKPLSVLASDNASVAVTGSIAISAIPLNGAITLRGISLTVPESVLSVSSCSGSVRLEQLDLTTSSLHSNGTTHTPRLVITDSSQVRLSGITAGAFQGNPDTSSASSGIGTPPETPAVLTATKANIALYNCALTGLPGRDAADDPSTLLGVFATRGGDAIAIGNATQLKLINCSVRGGFGGDGWKSYASGCLSPTDGGAAVHITSGLSNSVAQIAAQLTGGAPGAMNGDDAIFSCPGIALPGLSVTQDPGTTVFGFVQTQPRPQVYVEAILEENQPITLSYLRKAGDMAFIGISLAPSDTFSSQLYGYEVGEPVILLPLGMTNGLGAASLTLPAVGNALPSGVGLTLYVQALGLEIDQQGTFVGYVGQFATCALVDAN